MTYQGVAGDVDHPVFFLREQYPIYIGVGEIDARVRGVYAR